jgi:hypothetical protein
VDFVRENEKLKECVDVDKKYWSMIKRDCMAFLDQEENHRTRKITTATFLRNYQDVLSNYLQKRKAAMRRSSIERAESTND